MSPDVEGCFAGGVENSCDSSGKSRLGAMLLGAQLLAFNCVLGRTKKIEVERPEPVPW